MVINVGWLKSGKIADVKADIKAVRDNCAATPLKVILETCLLSDEQIVQVCEMCRELDVALLKHQPVLVPVALKKNTSN